MKGRAGRDMSIASGAIRLRTARMTTSSAWRRRARWAGSDMAAILGGGAGFAVPVYCRADHTFDMGLRRTPAELAFGLGGGGVELRRIAFAPRPFDHRDRLSRQFGNRGQHLAHRDADAGPEVERMNTGLGLQQVQGFQMRFG